MDANHNYECVKSDFEKYGEKLEEGGWVIFDDIEWPGVKKLWKEIEHLFYHYHFIAGGAMFARKI